MAFNEKASYTLAPQNAGGTNRFLRQAQGLWRFVCLRSLIELGSLFAGMTVARSAGTGTAAGYATKLSIMGTTYTANLFPLDGMEIKDLTGTAGSAAGVLMGHE